MDKTAFKHIYQQHVTEIRNYISYRSGDTMIADDVSQETFIKLWEKRANIDPTAIRALLYKIANGIFIDYIRKNKHEIDYVTTLPFTVHLPEESEEENEAYKERCTKALSCLTEKERTVFLLNKKDGWIYEDIAKYLNISSKAVEKRMSSALKKIKKQTNAIRA